MPKVSFPLVILPFEEVAVQVKWRVSPVPETPVKVNLAFGMVWVRKVLNQDLMAACLEWSGGCDMYRGGSI